MPPVVNRAVGELVGGVQEDLLPAALRLDREPDLGVLQLVAEAVGAALLVVAAAPPEPARDRLVAQPVVDEQVQGGIWRAHAVGREPRSPRVPDLVEGALDRLDPRRPFEQRLHFATVGRDREHITEHVIRPGLELDGRPQRRDRVAVAAELRRPRLLVQGLRQAQVAVASQERRLVALRRAHLIRAGERGDVREVGVPVPVLAGTAPPTCGCGRKPLAGTGRTRSRGRAW